MSKSIEAGDRIPEFELPDQDGRLVRSADLLKSGPLILFFYPRDESPGCTVEACSFRDANADFAKAGARVVGISSDDVESHKRFVDKHTLGYTLLADDKGAVRERFGVGKMLGLVDGRVTFIVDGAGVVRRRYNSMLRVQKHVDEALAAVREIAH
jgi:peroxiredoxin Q/BCP